MYKKLRFFSLFMTAVICTTVLYGLKTAIPTHAAFDLLVYETPFENSGDTDWLSASTNYDSSQYLSSAQSLKYTRSSSSSYVYPSKRLPASAGESYYATVWIKTSGLSSSGGATMAIEALSSTDTWLGGKYVNGIRAGQWTKLIVPMYTLPANTAKISISLYLEQGTTGTAWFDDLKVYEVQPSQLVYAYLDYPSYRGKLFHMDHTDIRVKTIPYVWSADFSGYTTKISLYNQAGTVMNSATYTGQQSTATIFDGSALVNGNYKLVIQLIKTSTGQVKGYIEKPITKTASAPANYVDKYGRLWKDGSLFFPIGIYTSDITTADMLDLNNSSINTILPYVHPDAAKLDLANSYGLKVIYSFKDFYYGSPHAPAFITSVADEANYIAQHVNWFNSHPALLAWYLNDEAPLDERLPAHYEAVIANDADHPAYIVDYNVPSPDNFMRSSDIFGMDRYVVKGLSSDPISEPSSYQRDSLNALPFRGQWPVVQAHNLANYGQGGTRPPTLAELRNMAWQYLTEGATGLMFYSLFDLQNDASGQPYSTLLGYVKQVAAEVEEFVPHLLSIEAAPLTTTTGGSWLNWTVKQYNNKTYIFAVNNGKTNQTASFQVAGAQQVKVLKEGRLLPVTTSTFTDSFVPLQVHIYEVEG